MYQKYSIEVMNRVSKKTEIKDQVTMYLWACLFLGHHVSMTTQPITWEYSTKGLFLNFIESFEFSILSAWHKIYFMILFRFAFWTTSIDKNIITACKKCYLFKYINNSISTMFMTLTCHINARLDELQIVILQNLHHSVDFTKSASYCGS